MNENDLYKSVLEQSVPIYFLYGEERYSIDKAINISKETLNENFRELNFNVIDSEYDIDVDMMINSCESIPFMDSKRVIVVKNSDLFQNTNKNYSKEDIKKILNYIDFPSKTTTLIFAPTQVDKRSELYKAIKKKYEVYQSDKLDKIKFSTWVSNKFKEKQVHIDKNSIEYFIQKSGYLYKESDVTLLDVESEIEKISLDKNALNISIEDIDRVTRNVEENDVFKFIDYVFLGESENAYFMMKTILNAQKSSILVLSLLGRQISLLAKIYILKRNRYSNDSIATTLMMHPFVVKKCMIQLKNYSYTELLNLYNLCSDMDYRIKKGQIRDVVGIEVMVSKICKKTDRA